MISLTMDMVQYDCPYIEASEDYEVRLSGMHWEFDTAVGDLETRVMVSATDGAELDNALGMLKDHEAVDKYRLLARRGDEALIRNMVEETDAMKALRAHDGYLTGPFEAHEGSERWHVGFDRGEYADEALSDLERDNDFTVESRNTLSFADYFDVVNNVDAAKAILEAMRNLTDTERETVLRAMEAGYFEAPREATVTDLADEFDVSTTGASKNIRRSERKLLGAILDSLEDVEQ
ncbi:helix-turn-helix domain-containing protein [Halobacteriales archaeon Cl-PHB]